MAGQHDNSEHPVVEQLAEANVPVLEGTIGRITIFGTPASSNRIVALEFGRRQGVALVRIHSECFTGDVLGSLRCDCGPQLRFAMRAIASEPWGILLYCQGHEGRGIGLIDKIRAYALQERGMDTVESNRALGYPPDLREFDTAASVLKALGATRVRLLTNNPQKVQALLDASIDVVERVPLHAPVNDFNRDYLRTKRVQMGHSLVEDEGSGGDDAGCTSFHGQH
jgi:GTP cyclohydrolase II